MIHKIGHYSLENPGTVYDEEAMTALELAGRTAYKVNECIDQVNKNTEALPGMVSDDVQKHIDGGAFDKQIDAYAGELEEHIVQVDQKQSNNLDNQVKTLNKRIDNIIATPSDGTPTELVDARLDEYGTAHGSLGASVRDQIKQAVNAYSGFMYLGANSCIKIRNGSDAGDVIISSGGRWSYYGLYGGGADIAWETAGVDIAGHMVTTVEKDGTIFNVDITLPAYKTLVWNRKDKLYHIRNNSTVDTHDIVLVQNTHHNAFRGCLVEEWKYRNILANVKNAYAVRGAYLYGGSGFKMVFEQDETTPALNVTMFGRPTVCFGSSDVYLAEFDGDHIEHIADKIEYPTGNNVVATFKIPGWNALVFNHIEKRWRMRWRANLQEGDILALATGYCQPLCGTLLDEWSAKKNQEFEDYMTAESMSSNPPAGVLSFAESIRKFGCGEKFIWFTDPHLCEASGWQSEFEVYKKQLKACFDSTPVTFAVCGGDWLGNNDTQAEACFKLGFIGGQMRSIFGDKYYPVVGNHDTNYQGTTVVGGEPKTGRLDNETIANLWNIPSNFYSFQGENTRFFVFDSELDWDLTMSSYKKAQVQWFAEQLRDNPSENMAAIIHIYYNWDGTTNHTGEMGKKITEIANAYNTRGSITFNGATFNYSGATGKFRFVLAGHNHGDLVKTEDNIPVILTTKTRQDGTPTFDLCLVNYDTNKLHLCRVGSGESRTVDI